MFKNNVCVYMYGLWFIYYDGKINENFNSFYWFCYCGIILIFIIYLFSL